MIAGILAFLGAAKAFVIYGVLGAILGGLAAIVSRLVGGATGIFAAIALGALLIGGGASTGAFQRAMNASAQSSIDKLKREKAALETSLALANASKEQLDKAVAEAKAVEADNAEVIEALQAELKKDSAQCGVSEKELELLNKLR